MRDPLKVGFIGLGIMGGPMAGRLLDAGYSLTVHTRTRKKAEPLLGRGAVWADTPADTARDANVVITIVTDTPDVEAVLLGENTGVAYGARPGTLVVDMSTISPEATRRIAQRLAERGIRMLDAPVSGGDVGAREGTLSIMVGGAAEDFEQALPLFQVMGKNIVHVGPNGAGQATKLVNQVIVAGNLVAMAEGLAFAAKAGLDLEKTLQIVQKGAAGSWALDNYAPRVLRGDFAPGFMIGLQQKDLRLAVETAEALRLPVPATVLVQQLLRAAQAHGMDRDGTQALVRVYEQLGNFKLPPT